MKTVRPAVLCAGEGRAAEFRSMDSHVRLVRPLLVVLVLSLSSAVGIIRGQQPTGEIHLAVEDSAGERMQASGRIDGRAFQTDPQGNFDFQNLTPGRHRLEVSKPGFASQVVSVDVTPGNPVSRTVTLGSDLRGGQQPQVVVRGQVWQGCRLAPGGQWALMGTTMSPGFDYADYENGDCEKLCGQHPTVAELIRQYTM